MLSLADAIRASDPEPVSGSASLLNDMLSRTMSKDMGQRYQAVTDLLNDLRTGSSTANVVTPSIQQDVPSIAVLPCADMSPEKDQDYFCDGMAEEIINALSRVNNLHVVARTSAFAFEGKRHDVREIGRKLNVGHVLEGSVRKAGNRIRITTQLINVDDGYRLWAERFDRELDDIFAVQDEISLAIVDKLEANLLGGEKEALVKRPTNRVEVHNLYLLGRYHWNRFTQEDTERSRSYFQQAIALDPSHAPAYAGLASSYLNALNLERPSVAVPKVRQAAERALRLDPSNSEAHSSLALAAVFHERNWPDALFHSVKAVESDPNDPRARGAHAFYLAAAARHDDAPAEIGRAVTLDPIAPVVLENAAFQHYWARNYEQARRLRACSRSKAVSRRPRSRRLKRRLSSQKGIWASR